jgi:DNA topoisomerase-1
MSSHSTSLIIVESPSKAKTLQRFLGDEHQIEASVGHIRDLPKNDLGIDIDNGFKPTYVAYEDKKKIIAQLKDMIKKADTLYLATDPDREGEAIAWHLVELLQPKIPVKRLAFHEITKSAIQESFEHTRDIDFSLVSAQEARRILDRLWGYKVSAKLWQNVKGGLSAGRVQSPTIKIVVDREKERAKFVESEYWSISAKFELNGDSFEAGLKHYDSQTIAVGKDFDKETGSIKKEGILKLDQTKAEELSIQFSKGDWMVSKVEQKPATQNPYAPFITSTLQQEGIRKLRMSSQQVMRTAQHLYEEGYITYMRTDSVILSDEALKASRKTIKELYGKEFLPDKPKFYKNKVKNAQEAHEAIRPAGATFTKPNELKSKLENIEFKLYDLIWKRTIASQMKSARLQKTTVDITNGKGRFTAIGKVIEFSGFLKVYVEDIDNLGDERDDKESVLPALKTDQKLNGKEFSPNQHFTKPASRFTEASLIKELETMGIGRPSTYASIMGNIQKRGYVQKINNALVPTFTAYAVVQFLERYFQDIVNLQFTAKLEDTLDAISRSEMKSDDFLSQFYFGQNGSSGLQALLEKNFDKEQSRTIMELKDKSGNSITVRIGRYGVYLQDGDINTTLPDTAVPSELSFDDASKNLKKKAEGPKILCKHPKTNVPVLLKEGRYGPYIQCGDKIKSLLPGMLPEEVTAKIAIDIIGLPKELGKHPESGETIKSDIGRYGPYIRCGKTSRSINSPDNILEISIKRAVELLSTEVQKSGPRVIKELGIDPETKATIEIKDGRYGAYVTDGKINATIPKVTAAADITLEMAIQLIADKKAKGPIKKRRFKKKT